MAKLDIKKIDKAMATDSKGIDGMDWYTADSPAFELSGFYWRRKGGIFRRLPVPFSKGTRTFLAHLRRNAPLMERMRQTWDSTGWRIQQDRLSTASSRNGGFEIRNVLFVFVCRFR